MSNETIAIRRLTSEDGVVLEVIARDAGEFDITGRSEPVKPLEPVNARTFLTHPDILFWAAEQDDQVAGFLLCFVQYLWHQPFRELMLYEIGVRESARRKGIGRSLIDTMETWMLEHRIADVWVPADNPGAEAFYQACGFERDDEQAVMMSKSLNPLESEQNDGAEQA
jgi:ribosomal protein S18 acetylase RimI-like enzyme